MGSRPPQSCSQGGRTTKHCPSITGYLCWVPAKPHPWVCIQRGTQGGDTQHRQCGTSPSGMPSRSRDLECPGRARHWSGRCWDRVTQHTPNEAWGPRALRFSARGTHATIPPTFKSRVAVCAAKETEVAATKAAMVEREAHPLRSGEPLPGCRRVPRVSVPPAQLRDIRHDKQVRLG